MEIGYKEENSADEYYFTKDEAIAMAKKICADLEREYKESKEWNESGIVKSFIAGSN